ncbi:glucan biosynthesis protein [Chelatococcus reniformis]|uniref:Glucans biosynthesis protein G n=1 Tax=Chelatococcus reniformis TaxID=1494448 RepID=A0A916XDH9_9HYPH|nr:glucan biosynthesis protein G [Chelatococcus reniformis]GGC63691.1 glucans biosynthesis protein G [Chelatococcus reniformis]
MSVLSRRHFIEGLAALVSLAASAAAAQAQGTHAPARPDAQPPAGPAIKPFGYDDVIRRARELSMVPYEDRPNPLPEALAKLDFDAWRDIRFRTDKALLASSNTPFRMQMFHPGFLFQRPVIVNVVRDGIATPVPYSAQLFDYGRNKFDKPLPVNVGFAGLRLHYPLNNPTVNDELISFLGASYFRFLGRGQVYGLSARGLAIGIGGQEEFPAFREFWVDVQPGGESRAVVYALLDGPSVTGAYQFNIYPANETVVDAVATVFPRKPIAKLGIAPLTSMFFIGENDRRFIDDYRPEVHDSDGLLIHSGTGEWIWRPLRNPKELAVSSFMESNVRGFGLIQRDRIFEHYEDLDIAYELRPGYWVEPRGQWGEGHVELVELPTTDETNDNIVVAWVPKSQAEPGQTLVYRYAIRAVTDTQALHPGGIAINSYQSAPKALGSAEVVKPNTRRLMVDFNGGELPYWLKDPSKVQVDASISSGRIIRTFIVPNPKTEGFRAGIDIEAPPGQTVDVRVFLRAGTKALTETWIFPWRADGAA